MKHLDRAANWVLCLTLLTGTVSSRLPASVTDSFTGQAEAISSADSPAGLNSSWPSKVRAPQELDVHGLWVDAVSGDDQNDGLSPTTAFRSIQQAADVADPGTTVHILPGIYRETVRPALSGTSTSPIVYRAEAGRGTVIIRGSEPANSLPWNQLTSNSIGLRSDVDPANLYYADLSAWALTNAPRFVVRLDGESVSRLPVAREPDWQVHTEWKVAEFWWAADGGASVPTCGPAGNPNPDCDEGSRSTTQLIDRQNDSEPAGIEPGNLTTLGDLTGATLVAMDTDEGHYVYHRRIVAHDVTSGMVTVDSPCEFDSGSGQPGLGWGSKYYVEDHPALLDSPGEWWYNARDFRLYLWPPQPGNPAGQNIEVSRRNTGFDLSDRSYITIDGLTMELLNDAAVSEENNDASKSYQNTVRNSTLRFANVGIELGQGTDGPETNITRGFSLEGSDVGHMDSRAIRSNYWWSGGTADSFTRAGIVDTAIRNNELHHLGFNSDGDNGIGVLFNLPDRVVFEGNYVHDVAQNGVAFSRSVIQSSKDRDFSPDEIKTGGILIHNNLFEKSCLLDADCGELKIQGSAPDNHVFRDLLITGNVFRDTVGWTYVSEKRGRWSGGRDSDVQGMGGFGLYVDNASGVHAYRNIAYNNASSAFHLYSNWWDGPIVLYNNVAANSLNGIRLDGNTQPSVDTQIANNALVDNEGYGILIYQSQADFGNFLLDHDLYYGDGWRSMNAGGMEQPGDMALYRPNRYYGTLNSIQANTPWERQGTEGDPAFQSYDFGDHAIVGGSWPDFHLTSDSIALLDRGTTALPDSLVRLLQAFGVNDYRQGQAYDIGRFESSFDVVGSPIIQSVCPGTPVLYTLRLHKGELPREVTLAVTNPSPVLSVGLSSPRLTPDEPVTLTVSEGRTGLLAFSDTEYKIPIIATAQGFTETTNVGILVGGLQTCLPLIMRSLFGH